MRRARLPSKPAHTPWEGEGAVRRPPPAVLFSAPVWPFGDWLPCSCLERAKQVHGQFGLAGDRCPSRRVSKPQGGAVEKLARKHKPCPVGLASVLAIAAHGMPDRGYVVADLAG